MNIEFDKSFEKSLRHVHNPRILRRLKRIIIQFENYPSISEIPNIKKLAGFSSYYRIRIGDYRVGFEIVNNSIVRFIVIAHRKDIYKIFP